MFILYVGGGIDEHLQYFPPGKYCKCQLHYPDNFKAPVVLGPCFYPVYLKLAWLGRSDQTLSNRASVGVAFLLYRVVFYTIPLFPSFDKDGLQFCYLLI